MSQICKKAALRYDFRFIKSMRDPELVYYLNLLTGDEQIMN